MRSLCILGDSIGRGVVLDEASGRYTVITDRFSSLLAPMIGARVKNHAAFGSTIEKGIKITGRYKDELSSFSAVLLEFGGNDCDFDWAAIAKAPGENHEPKTPLKLFEEKYLELIQAIKQAGGRPLLMNLPPIDPLKYFDRISRGLNGEAILEWLGDKARIYRWHEMYSITVQNLAKLTSTPIIDIRSDFLRRKDCPQLICSDGIHPNAMGHRQMADTLADFFAVFFQCESCLSV
ncbi:MAG: SGNH/GDSL hydrolase family protein [Christensenellales bacterium]|jgi:acyl-CoA thioesterase-1